MTNHDSRDPSEQGGPLRPKPDGDSSEHREDPDLASTGAIPEKIRQFVVVPIDDVNYASLRAMSFARTICDEILVLHVATDTARAEKVRQKMKTYAPDLKLVVVESPLRGLMRPMLSYIEALHEQLPGTFVSIVLPEFITAHWWERFLHNRTAEQLTRAFKKHPDVVVILVPYLLRR
jgi:hypothetical protein